MQKTDFDFEVLIHDDASTDGTQEIIKCSQRKHPDIIKPIFQTENQYSKGQRGISTKFNLPRAQGKYIALCEGDDYWADSLKLQKQVDFLEEHDECIAVAHNAMVLNDNGNTSSFGVKPSRYLTQKEVFISRQFATGSILYRNLSHIDFSMPKGTLAGDTPLFLTLLKHGKIYYDNIVTSVYRRGQQGVTSTFNDENVKERFLKQQFYMHSLLVKKQKRILRNKVDAITGRNTLISVPIKIAKYIDAFVYRVLHKLFRLKRFSSFDTDGCFSLLKVKYMLSYKEKST